MAGSKRRIPSKGVERSAALPARFTPELATLVATPPEGEAWLHELKYDGYRIGCRVDRGAVRLLSRNGKDWTARFPSVRDAAARLGARTALLDGEVTVVLPNGRTSFQALQNAFAAPVRDGELVYFVFDLLHLDGEDVSRLSLEERKTRLQRLLERTDGVLRYADHIVGNGARMFSEACRQGAEGIVSKRRDRPYRPGRGTEWVKTKCVAQQELVIGGFTDPEGSRAGLGALLVGVHDGSDRLVFAGKVGTGFTQASAQALRRQLDALEQSDCPFTPRPAGRLGRVHWVRPNLVAAVTFTEWTADGKIRHPSFQGLRADKRASEVVRERPAAAPSASAPQAPARTRR
jgi:bifunctional non-homologous end joining protein LigD